MSKAQRDKGKKGEREVATILRAWGYDAHRPMQSAGARECDVEGAPWWIEVKIGKSVRFWEAISQAETDAAQDERKRPPVVVFRRDGETQWRAIIELEDLLELAGEGS
jgi:hypothetical protein